MHGRIISRSLRWFVVAVGGLVALGAVGCAAPPAVMLSAGVSAAQTGVTSFINRELHGATIHSLEQVYDAVLAAAEGLGFAVHTALKDGDSAYFALVESDGTRTSVRLQRETEVVTSVRVRVGVRGDRVLSTLILKETQRRLGADEFFY